MMLAVRLIQNASLITLVSALALLGPASLGLFLSGVPTVFGPFPALTVIPALMLAQWHLEYAAVFIPAVLFLVWNPQLFRAEGKIPKRSYVLFVLLAILSAVDFAISWKSGLKYQGPPFTAIVCSINIAWLGFLGLAFRRTLKASTSFQGSLFLHWMLFAWLGWYAFPWLGELI
jgi:hypothetical protein